MKLSEILILKYINPFRVINSPFGQFALKSIRLKTENNETKTNIDFKQPDPQQPLTAAGNLGPL